MAAASKSHRGGERPGQGTPVCRVRAALWLANRFLLYGLAALLGVVMMLTSVVGQTADPDAPAGLVDLALFLLFSSGIGASACYGLAFFPPAAYRQRFAASEV